MKVSLSSVHAVFYATLLKLIMIELALRACSKSNLVALLYYKGLYMIIVIWVFVPAGTVFVVEVDLEPKVEALLFSFQHFHCLHMLLTLMVCSVTGFAYPATAVVPCVECSFSNTIGLHPWLLANAPYNCNGPWTSKSLCQPPDNQSDEASCPQRTLSAGSDKGSSTRDNSAPPDPCKHH